MKAVLSVVFALAVSAVFSGQALANVDPQGLVIQGNLRYKEGDFQNAVEHYQQAIRHGIDNAHVLYNCANAFYRLGHYGQAIANYRRALSLRPQDPDIRANLALARKASLDKVGDDASSFFLLNPSRLLFLNSLLGRSSLKVVFLALYVLFWLVFSLMSLEARGLRQLSILLFVLTLFVGLSAFGTRSARDGSAVLALTPHQRAIRPAVITAHEAKVYSGNSEKYQVVFLLHDGAEVEAHEQRGAWVEVMLPGGRHGWVRIHEVEVLYWPPMNISGN